MNVGSVPWEIIGTPNGTKVYVANSGSDNISVIDTTNNTVIATGNVGSIPVGVAASPDGTHVYVANNASNNVSVINTTTNTVTATIEGLNKPFRVAVTS